MDYPSSKQELMQQAQKNNANQNVMQAIENLLEQKFNSPTYVQKAWGQGR